MNNIFNINQSIKLNQHTKWLKNIQKWNNLILIFKFRLKFNLKQIGKNYFNSLDGMIGREYIINEN